MIRGAGEKAFAPGNDIAEFATSAPTSSRRAPTARTMTRTIEAIGNCRHPVVAQIHGICVGGGLEIAGLRRHAHLRRVEPLRRADQPPRPGDGLRRDRRADRAWPARRWRWRSCSKGACSTRSEALAKGLVTRVVADDQVEAEARATAQRIADGAPLVARWHKKFARRLRDPAPLTPAELDEGFACYGTEDFRIGYQAFLAKTQPEFKGADGQRVR